MSDRRSVSPRDLLDRHAHALAVLALGVVASLALWRVAVDAERDAIRRTVASEADFVGVHLTSRLTDREEALHRMAERWRVQERSHEPEWRSDARLYASHFPGMDAFAWIDPEGRVRWAEPPDLRSTFADVLADLEVRRAVADLEGPETVPAPRTDATDPRRGVWLHPVSAGERPDGVLAVVLDHPTSLGTILARPIAEGYDVSVRQEDRVVFARSPDLAADAAFEAVRPVDAGDRTWRVAIAPLPATVAAMESPLDEAILIMGLLASGLLGLAVTFARRARDRERALRETESLMERITENIPVLVAVHSPDLSDVVYVNRRFETLLRRSAEAIQQDPGSFLEVVHPEDRERVARAMAHDLPTGSFAEEYRVLSPSGETRWLQAWSAPIRTDSGEIGHLVTVARDVTDRKRAETELKRSNEDLQQFAYVASHDLQEPLRMVTSYLGLIEGRYGDLLDEKGHRFLHFAVDGAQRMKRLIDGLLQYSRVHTAGERFSPVDVDEILDEALANLKAPIRESGAEIRRDDLPVCHADATQLALVFQNLISNAIKFRDDTPPVVEISATERPDGWVFTVRDNGVGFDPTLVDQLFILFRRLHGREEYPGTGIGLALCRRVVERHGGRIWAESEPGVGSVFSFTLPNRPEVHSP